MKTICRRFASLFGIGLALGLGGCAAQDDATNDQRTSNEMIATPSAYGSGWVTMGFVADLRAAIDTSPADTTGSNFTKVAGAITAQYGFGLESIVIRGPFQVGYFVDLGSGTRPPQTAQVNGETVAVMTGKLSGDAADRLFEAMKPVPSVDARRSPAGRIECLKDTDDTDAKTTCFIDGVLGFSTEPLDNLGPDSLP